MQHSCTPSHTGAWLHIPMATMDMEVRRAALEEEVQSPEMVAMAVQLQE